MNGLIIRKATREDKKDILKLIESYKPYHWDIKPANEHFTRFFESNDFPQDNFFVGLIDNKIVSVIGYCSDRLNEIGVYWLGWFYTHKDHNYRGIGRYMFNFVISELRAKKAKQLFVNTSSHPFYRHALKFYRKMGFKKVDVLNDFYEKGEDQIIMSRKLDS
jgi:ribosomal protein S18 acetylase RimI-like enzyme